MVFKRREKQGWVAWLTEMVYPKGGFKRATQYVLHRMRRLPDDPKRIARGLFAGSLVGFLPLPGMQFLAAWGASRLVNGNLLAALLGTFNTNPITTPFIAVFSVSLGHWILGIEAPLTPEAIGIAIADASHDLWRNLGAVFGHGRPHWEGLIQFWHTVYVPYFIGALIIGTVISGAAYYVTIPLVRAYQNARADKAAERREKRFKLREKLKALALRGEGKDAADSKDGGDPPTQE